MADNDSLSEEVNSELEAVQFTIIDAGSLWVSTCVKHTVTHKKKKQEVYSNIGVKLTKRLAEEKGIDIWGEAEKAREDSQEYRECLHEFEQEAKQEVEK